MTIPKNKCKKCGFEDDFTNQPDRVCQECAKGEKMKDLDNEREMMLKCLLNLEYRIGALELKFNMEEDDEDWKLWFDLKKIVKEIKR